MPTMQEIFTGPYRVITTIIGIILLSLFLFCACCCVYKCRQENSMYNPRNDSFNSSFVIEEIDNKIKKQKIAEIGIEPMTFRL